MHDPLAHCRYPVTVWRKKVREVEGKQEGKRGGEKNEMEKNKWKIKEWKRAKQKKIK